MGDCWRFTYVVIPVSSLALLAALITCMLIYSVKNHEQIPSDTALAFSFLFLVFFLIFVAGALILCFSDRAVSLAREEGRNLDVEKDFRPGSNSPDGLNLKPPTKLPSPSSHLTVRHPAPERSTDVADDRQQPNRTPREGLDRSSSRPRGPQPQGHRPMSDYALNDPPLRTHGQRSDPRITGPEALAHHLRHTPGPRHEHTSSNPVIPPNLAGTRFPVNPQPPPSQQPADPHELDRQYFDPLRQPQIQAFVPPPGHPTWRNQLQRPTIPESIPEQKEGPPQDAGPTGTPTMETPGALGELHLVNVNVVQLDQDVLTMLAVFTKAGERLHSALMPISHHEPKPQKCETVEEEKKRVQAEMEDKLNKKPPETHQIVDREERGLREDEKRRLVEEVCRAEEKERWPQDQNKDKVTQQEDTDEARRRKQLHRKMAMMSIPVHDVNHSEEAEMTTPSQTHPTFWDRCINPSYSGGKRNDYVNDNKPLPTTPKTTEEQYQAGRNRVPPRTRAFNLGQDKASAPNASLESPGEDVVNRAPTTEEDYGTQDELSPYSKRSLMTKQDYGTKDELSPYSKRGLMTKHDYGANNELSPYSKRSLFKPMRNIPGPATVSKPRDWKQAGHCPGGRRVSKKRGTGEGTVEETGSERESGESPPATAYTVYSEEEDEYLNEKSKE